MILKVYSDDLEMSPQRLYRNVLFLWGVAGYVFSWNFFVFLPGGNLENTNRNRGLSEMEAMKFRLAYEIIAKRLKKKHMAAELGLSIRQVGRLIKKVKRDGANGLIHGLVGKKGNRALSEEKEISILDLWKYKYMKYDFNFSHFTNKLNEVEKITVSKEKVRKLLRARGYESPCKREQQKHRSKRERRLYFGEMIQQDTSPHDWLGTGVKYHLVVAIDDATSKVLFMKLYEADGTLPNMEAFKAIIRKHGLPVSFYVDAAAWFKVTRNGIGSINKVLDRKTYITQVQRALKELGVKLIIAKSPQAKGRVERGNRTFQDRLISELRLRNIITLEKANKYIEEEYIDDHNMRFAVEPASQQSAFIKYVSVEALDYILCFRFYNRVKNDNTVKKARYYELQLLPSDKRFSWAQAKVEVTIMTNGTIEVRHADTRELIPFEILKQNKIHEDKYAKLVA